MPPFSYAAAIAFLLLRHFHFGFADCAMRPLLSPCALRCHRLIAPFQI